MISFIRERILKPVLIYIASGWGLLQAIDFFSGKYGWSAKLFDVSLILLAGGLVGFVLHLSIRNTKENYSFGRLEFTGHALIVILVAMMSIKIIGWGDRSEHPISAIPNKSLAILPLTNLSNDSTQEYLSDGITDEIITRLSNHSSFERISSGTSVMVFKNSKKNAREIGKQLGVRYLIEGSIQRAGEFIRVRVRLIDSFNDKEVWSESFQPKFKELFKLQDEIASKVTTNLELPVNSTSQLNSEMNDPEVYNYFLKALYSFKKGDHVQSLTYNLKAIELDSTFIPAYAYLAISTVWASPKPSDKEIRQAVNFANKAVALDSNSAEAHSALGLIAWVIQRDFAKAKIEFEKSIHSNPTNVLIRNRYSYFLIWMKNFERAYEMSSVALRLDPAFKDSYITLAYINIYSKKFTEAEKILSEAKIIFPNWNNFNSLQIQNEFYHGDYKRVINEIVKSESDIARLNEDYLMLLARSYFQIGNKQRGMEVLTLAKTKAYNYSVSKIFAEMSSEDSCKAWLNKAYATGMLTNLKIEPVFDKYRNKKWFQDIYNAYGFNAYQP